MNKMLVGAVSGLAVLLVVGGVATGLFMSGKLAFVNPDAEVVDAYTAVCDKDMISEYNESLQFRERNGESEPSVDEDGLKSLRSTIENTASNQNDPSCQTMLFWIAVYFEEYEPAKAAYERVKALYDKRLFADSDILSNQPLSSYESAMYSFSPASSELPEGGSFGG